MRNKKSFITAGLVLAATATTAHLMQRSGGPGADNVTISPMPVAAAAAATAVPTPFPTQMANAASIEQTAVSAELQTPPSEAASPALLPQMGASLRDRMAPTATTSATQNPTAEEEPRNKFGLTCGPILSASVDDAAMVSLTLTAPCRADQTVRIRHGDLEFSDRLNQFGTITVAIPALATQASFAVTFEDGVQVDTAVEVPMADEIDRVALVFQGNAGFQIHALEFGAEYDQAGHVWVGAARGPVEAMRNGGGYLTVLGDARLPDGVRAEVYTFPGVAGDKSGVVRLSVEAEVTASNCDTEVAGQTIERTTGGDTKTVALTVSIPDCAAIGEFLVLKNLLRDLKIASN